MIVNKDKNVAKMVLTKNEIPAYNDINKFYCDINLSSY